MTEIPARPSADALPARTLRWRLASWATVAWLAAVAGRYLWTAGDALRHPANGGAEERWALVWIAYCLAALLWHGLVRGPLAAALWRAGLAAAAAAMILASGRLLPALVCAWLVSLAGCLGGRILRFLRATPSDVAFEWPAVAIPAGLAVLATAALLLGIAGLLAPGWLAALAAALTLRERHALWTGAKRLTGAFVRTALTAEQGILVALCGFPALFNLAWALAPEVQYDALNYHLAVPAAFLARHRVVDLPSYWHSYFAQMAEMLFAFFLALGGPIAVKLLVLAMGIVAALGVFALGRALGNDRVGLWAAALFSTTPMTVWLSTTADTDLAAALFLLAGFIALLRWRERREDGWLWSSGWLAGAALGVKATAAYGLPVLALTVLRDLARRRAVSPLDRWRSLAGFAAAGSLSALPWYLPRYVFTGNPFFPLLNNFFPGARALPPGFDPGGVVGEGYGRAATIWRTLQSPFLLSFAANRFREFPPGATGAALAIAFPLGFLLPGLRRGGWVVLLAACGIFLVLWDRTFGGARLAFPVLPLAAALAVAAVESRAPPGWRRRLAFGLLSAILLAQVAEAPVQFWNIPDRAPVRVALGRETPERFLLRALPEYAALEYVNREARPGQRVLGVAVANVRFYSRPPLDTMGENWDLQGLVARTPPDRLAAGLASMGYAFLLLHESRISEGAAPVPFLERPFLDRFADLAFERGGWRVYRLRGGER